MLDLYSGLGGASEAMLQDPEWEVLRVENNEELLGHVPNTWFKSVPDLLLRHQYMSIQSPIDLLWASPPCTEFSLAYGAPGPVAHREGREFSPDMSLLEAAIDLRDILEPKYWCIENVVGAIRHFKPYLGEPQHIEGAFVLWTNLPTIVLPAGFSHRKQDQDTWSSNPLRANLRGRLPLELSEAVKKAAECPTMEDFA